MTKDGMRQLTPRETMILLLAGAHSAGLGSRLSFETTKRIAVELLAEHWPMPIPRIPIDGLPGQRYSRHIDSAMDSLIGSGLDMHWFRAKFDTWNELAAQADDIRSRYAPEISPRLEDFAQKFVERLRSQLAKYSARALHS